MVVLKKMKEPPYSKGGFWYLWVTEIFEKMEFFEKQMQTGRTIKRMEPDTYAGGK
jgi:hypothetical protein